MATAHLELIDVSIINDKVASAAKTVEADLCSMVAFLADEDRTRWFVITYVPGLGGRWDEVQTIEAGDEARAFAQAELVIEDHAAVVVYRQTRDEDGIRQIVAIRTFRNAS